MSGRQIVNRLKTLADIEGVDVEVSDQAKTVYVNYRTERSLDFRFVWSVDHFIGYFTDKDGQQSHAVLSMWEPIEAVRCVTAYSILTGLRAGRRD